VKRAHNPAFREVDQINMIVLIAQDNRLIYYLNEQYVYDTAITSLSRTGGAPIGHGG
jgi:hypothetical protein